MRSVDLNCDLGEGCDNDAELMKYITSANIACGYHAGDAETMRRTIRLAIENNVAIGAHPGYRDRENFGRTQMRLSSDEIRSLVLDQLSGLKTVCDSEGACIRHIKPHGALYNQAATDPELSAAIAEAVKTFDGELILYGLSGSYLISEADKIGLKTASEVFADRTYQHDGSLTPRTEQNAMIETGGASVEQIRQMLETGTVTSVCGDVVPIVAETICVHGDGPHAVEFAKNLRRTLDALGFTISPLRNY
ncbi:MAG TPA: 5-oxoprolinase subunit PxpA [Pyrinomonadaceae bacterium]|nr:5-oxoprolinase subunit PxpA [Pyrinomonadaceae bacterium]